MPPTRLAGRANRLPSRNPSQASQGSPGVGASATSHLTSFDKRRRGWLDGPPQLHISRYNSANPPRLTQFRPRLANFFARKFFGLTLVHHPDDPAGARQPARSTIFLPPSPNPRASRGGRTGCLHVVRREAPGLAPPPSSGTGPDSVFSQLLLVYNTSSSLYRA